MKKALIHGSKIIEFVDEGKEFEVYPPLKWVSIANSTTTQDTFVDGKVIKFVKSLSDVELEINQNVNKILHQGILIGSKSIKLNSSMQKTLLSLQRLISSGNINPHNGYLKSNDQIIKRSDGADFTDEDIIIIASFSDRWSLMVKSVAINEKIKCSNMSISDLENYKISEINWPDNIVPEFIES